MALACDVIQGQRAVRQVLDKRQALQDPLGSQLQQLGPDDALLRQTFLFMLHRSRLLSHQQSQ